MDEPIAFNLTFTIVPDFEVISDLFEEFREDYEAGRLEEDDFIMRMQFKFATGFKEDATVSDLLEAVDKWEAAKRLLPDKHVVVAYDSGIDYTILHDNIRLSNYKDRRIVIKKEPLTAERSRLKRVASCGSKRSKAT